MNKRKKINRLGIFSQAGGFSLVEMLVAISIFSIVIVVVLTIFLNGFGGTQRIFGQQSVQESGRFIMESMSKEIRMSKINNFNGTAFASLPDGSSGPYDTLNITNSSYQNITYNFNSANKELTRAGAVLNSNNVNLTGHFYLVKNGTLPPRITMVMSLANKALKASQQTSINLETSISSRVYGQ